MSATVPIPRIFDAWSPQVDSETGLGPQLALVYCPFYEVLFGGARGGGKTDGLIGDWLFHAHTYGYLANGIFVRRTAKQLEDVIKRTLRLFPSTGARWLSGQGSWVWEEGPAAGATLKFRHLWDERDIEDYQGHAYTWAGFEELTNWANEYAYIGMHAAVRSADGVPVKIRASANPGGRGHGWVKSRFIDPAPKGYKPITDPDTGEVRMYIPSRLEDNKILMLSDPGYESRLKGQAREEIVKAWRWGIWDIVAGGMFDDVWSASRHIVSPFKIPRSWRIDRALDWGRSKPFSVGWYAESDGSPAPNGVTYPKGTIFRIAEWYGCQRDRNNISLANKGVSLTTTQVAAGIKAREEKILSSLGHTRIYPGPADSKIFSADVHRTIADDFEDEGIAWLPANKHKVGRINGWEVMRKYLAASLETPMEEPGFFVFENCIDFIRTVPVLPGDPSNPDDADTNSEDHIADETRYRLTYNAPKTFSQMIY